MVDGGRQILYLSLKSGLDLGQDFLVVLIGDETDAQTLGVEATSSADSVKVLISLFRHVVVNDDVDLFDVNASTQQISTDHDSVLALSEALVNGLSLLHGKRSATGDTWELLTTHDLVQFLGGVGRLGENDHLVKLNVVQQVDELPGLLMFLQFDEVLLQTVQIEFRLRVDVKLKGILHELLAGLFSIGGKSSTEHHNLSLGLAGGEDSLDLSPHIDFIKHLVALIQDEHLEVVESHHLAVDQVADSAWSTNNDVRRRKRLQQFLMSVDWHTTVEGFCPYVLEVLGESGNLVSDLDCKLSGVAKDDCGDRLWLIVEVVQNGKDEDCSLAHT